MRNLLQYINYYHFKRYLSDNRTLLTVASLLLIASVIMGVIFPELYVEAEEYNLEVDEIVDEDNDLTFTSLFVNNFTVDFITIIMGILFSIPSIILVINFGLMIGNFIANYGIILTIVGIIPHGIFEIPSSVFALCGAFLITKLEISVLKGIFLSNTSVKKELYESDRIIIDIFLSVVYIFILLAIAAFIEAYITGGIIEFFLYS